MSQCSGNPANCSFCGHQECAKSEVPGCAANPAQCPVCKGAGCVATECTGTCKSCSAAHLSTCRKKELSATEGIDRPAAA